MQYKKLYFFIFFIYILFSNIVVAQELVEIKGFEGSSFSRLVFNWQEPVKYQATTRGNELVVNFDRSGEIDVNKMNATLPNIINSSSYDIEEKQVKIILKNQSLIKTTSSGSSVIFEIKPLNITPEIVEINTPKVNKKSLNSSEILLTQIRLGKHQKYTRIVFDWEKKVKYKVSKVNDNVTIEFERYKKFLVPSNLKNRAPFVYNISQKKQNNKAIINIKTSERVNLKHFSNKNSIVLDVIHDGKISSKIELTENSKENLVKSNNKKNNEIIKNSNNKVNNKSISNKDSNVKKNDEKKSNSKKNASIEKPGKLNINIKKNEDGLSVFFEWENPTTAAVFERAGYNWVIFGGAGPVNIEPISKELSKDFISIEPIKIMRGLAFRLKVREGLFSQTTRRGSIWKVIFKSTKSKPSRPLLARRQPNWPTGPRVFIPLEGASSRIAIADPEVGDDLAVVPILQDGRGRADERLFAQFKLLSSSQGVVVERRSDDIRVATANYGVEISSPNLGLALSGDKKELADSDLDSEDNDLIEDISSILNFVEWRRETNIETLDQTRRQLELLASSVDADEKVESYLDIARLYISYGLSAETLGYLKLAYDIDPSIEENKEFKAIRGAASFLMGRIDDAFDDLINVEFGVDPSVSLWRGAVLASKKNWQEARQEFQLGVIALSDLIPDLRVRFQLLAAETAYNAGEIASAELDLEGIDPEEASLESISRGKLILGLARIASGDKTGGLEILDEVINENYRPTWAEAKVAFTSEKYKSGELGIKEAIDNLESLLFVWRGGEFELSLLKNLRDLYLDDENYRGAMNSLRTIRGSFKGTKDSEQAETDLNKLFLKLYLDGESEKMPPITALALYNEFSELTPDGEVGDKVINRLADRLVSVDLLEQAAQLLNYQVSFRLKGIEKGRVASKLAAVYLYDRQIDKCIKVLDDSKFDLLPNELKLERLYLRSRAHLLDKNYDKVIELLNNIDTKESLNILAEVYWKKKDWKITVNIIEKSLGQRWQSNEPLNINERNQIMQMTVALALLDDWENLSKVRNNWLNLMSDSVDSEPFDILTLNPDTESINFRRVAGRIAQTDTLDAFMKRYKKN